MNAQSLVETIMDGLLKNGRKFISFDIRDLELVNLYDEFPLRYRMVFKYDAMI
jgi:hypothetical protein